MNKRLLVFLKSAFFGKCAQEVGVVLVNIQSNYTTRYKT
jgi:hypothetical protein